MKAALHSPATDRIQRRLERLELAHLGLCALLFLLFVFLPSIAYTLGGPQ